MLNQICYKQISSKQLIGDSSSKNKSYKDSFSFYSPISIFNFEFLIKAVNAMATPPKTKKLIITTINGEEFGISEKVI